MTYFDFSTISSESLESCRAQATARKEQAERDLREAVDILSAIDVLQKHVRVRVADPTLTLPGIDTAQPTERVPVSFAQSVRDAIKTPELKFIQFTVWDVEEALRRLGAPLPVKSLRTRITLELLSLAAKGTITIVQKGIGKSPSRYRLTAEVPKGEGVRTLTRPAASEAKLQH